MPEGRRASRYSEADLAPYIAPQLRNASTGSRRGSAHDPAFARAHRHQAHHGLPASLATSPARSGEPAGCACGLCSHTGEAFTEQASQVSRPPLEVADIIRARGNRFIENNRSWLHWKHVKVLHAIARCRTAALGGHRDQCPQCGYQTISYNSCRNRHCPKCQTAARDKWLAARQQELLAAW